MNLYRFNFKNKKVYINNKEYEIKEIKKHLKNRFLIKILEVDNIDSAEKLRNSKVSISIEEIDNYLNNGLPWPGFYINEILNDNIKILDIYKIFNSNNKSENSENVTGGGRTDDLFGSSQDLTKSTFDDDENDSDNPILLMDPVTYSLTNEPDGMSVDTNGLISWTPVNGIFDSGLVTLTIQDGLEDGTVPVSETFSITVAPVDDMPVFTSDPITSINEDSTYSYTVAASDPDAGDTLTLSATTLPSWLSFNASNKTLLGTPENDDVGEHWVTLRATDTAGKISDQTFKITVINTNDLPKIMSSPITTIFEGQNYSYTFKSNDPDLGDSVILSVIEKPTWLSFNPNSGTLSGTPQNEDVGQASVILRAKDTSGSSVDQQFTITVKNQNQALHHCFYLTS